MRSLRPEINGGPEQRSHESGTEITAGSLSQMVWQLEVQTSYQLEAVGAYYSSDITAASKLIRTGETLWATMPGTGEISSPTHCSISATIGCQVDKLSYGGKLFLGYEVEGGERFDGTYAWFSTAQGILLQVTLPVYNSGTGKWQAPSIVGKYQIIMPRWAR